VMNDALAPNFKPLTNDGGYTAEVGGWGGEQVGQGLCGVLYGWGGGCLKCMRDGHTDVLSSHVKPLKLLGSYRCGGWRVSRLVQGRAVCAMGGEGPHA
jgi:hypothetical protein